MSTICGPCFRGRHRADCPDCSVPPRSRCPALLRGSQCFLDVHHLGMHTTDLRGVLWRDGEEETPMVLAKLDVRTMQPAGEKEPK